MIILVHCSLSFLSSSLSSLFFPTTFSIKSCIVSFTFFNFSFISKFSSYPSSSLNFPFRVSSFYLMFSSSHSGIGIYICFLLESELMGINSFCLRPLCPLFPLFPFGFILLGIGKNIGIVKF